MAKEGDTAGKELFDRDPRAWLALLGWPLPASTGDVTVVDSDLSAVSRAADKLVRVEGVAVPYMAHVEFQTAGDPDLDRRMLTYNVLARGRHGGRPVRSVAFLFRPAAAAGPTGRLDEVLDEHSRLLFTYRLVRLWELPTAAVLGGPLGTVPLAPLTVAPGTPAPDVTDVIRRARDRVSAEATPDAVESMLRCTRLLIGLRFGQGQQESIMPSLEQVLQESWIYKRDVEEGLRQGLQQGREQGRQQVLLDLGTDKFGPPDPATLGRLMAVNDVDQLRQLGRRLLTAETWADVFAGD